jgi:glyoxylase-like metal-dependent hydrolase (beta-lactamase superfamily II)
VRPYDRGLHDLGNGVFAYLQPDGSWGWSNAGLTVDGEDALLVDTLFDLHLTRRMLEQMRSADRRAESIDTIVITHANPDHTNGNSLLPEAHVIASQRAADEMAHDDPAMLAGIMRQAKANADPVSRYLVDCFGAFDFEGIPKTVPDQPFVGQRSLQVGRKRIELIELGSAHTGGDIVIHSPDDRVLYTGDLLFIGGHPIMWAGPIGNWIAACDRLLALDVQYVVPGHGPITDERGIRAVRDYLALVEKRATAAFQAGVSVADAARDLQGELNRAGYSHWGDGERIIVTVSSHYRHLGGATDATNVGAMFAEMAKFRAGSPGRPSG